MKALRRHLAPLLARFAGAVGRLAGKSGTSLPGRVLLAVDPTAIRSMSAEIGRGSVVISATNGKTTTAALTAGAMRAAALHPVHNAAGANMAGGIAASLLADPERRSPGSIGLFEVDEFWLPEVAEQLDPRFVLLSNLFRDQLDRYGELDSIFERWRTAAGTLALAGTKFILCADDPGVASLADDLAEASVIWFGIEDTSNALAELPHSADAGKCRSCGSALLYDAVLLGHLGHWRCESCGRKRPEPRFSVTDLELEGATSSRLTVDAPSGSQQLALPLPGIYNAYNAVAAWALASELGIDPAAIKTGLESSRPAFGRAEQLELAGRETTLLLVKNPTGANEVIRTLALEGDELDLVIALNDGIADGRDVSWVWDADFEALSGSVRRVTCCGTRSGEMALRLRYAGFEPDSIRVAGDPLEAVDSAARDGNGRLWVLPTYTALLDLRSRLEDRGDVGAIG
ncbi:MAG: MurT ligase domain-containing protein [Actinomycetes bacterium]